MTPADKARALIAHPAALGRALGFRDFRDDLQGEWIRKMLTAPGDMTLQAHRGSYKTTSLCVAIALFMIWRHDKNIIFLRKTDNDIAEVVKAVKRILSTDVFSEVYRALTGSELTITRENSAEITLGCYTAPRGSAQLLGIGIGGSLTGKHADIIITDDIVNLRDRISRAERERTKAIYQELQNVRNPGGRIINTGTPWHREDAFMLMPEPERFDVYATGLLSDADIERLRQSMSPSLFAANYELRHIAAEQALFTEAPRFTEDAALLRNGIAHIDAAYGGEDYTAFTCARKDGGTVYMYGRLFAAHVDTVLDTCLREAQRLMCAPVHCEDNGDKGYLAREMQRAGVRAKTYHESENKYIKISSYLRKWWPSIVFLKGTDSAYIDQIMDYTENAEHDDAPDSAASIVRLLDTRRAAVMRNDIVI